MKNLASALIVIAIVAAAVTLIITDHAIWLVGLPLLAGAIGAAIGGML